MFASFVSVAAAFSPRVGINRFISYVLLMPLFSQKFDGRLGQ